MADRTTPDAPHADLIARLHMIDRRGGLGYEAHAIVTEAAAALAALGDTVPREQYDAKEVQWQEASRLLRARTGTASTAERERDEARAERDTYRSDAEAWRRYMAQQASVDNATPPKYLTGGPTGNPPRRPRGSSPSHVLTRADAQCLGVPLDAQVPRALHPDKTPALAEDREADPTDDCD